MHKIINWISDNPRTVALLAIAVLLLLFTCGCAGKTPEPKTVSEVIYEDCFPESGLIIVIDTPGGPLPLYGPVGCRCYTEIDGVTLMTTKPIDHPKCEESDNPDATWPPQVLDEFRPLEELRTPLHPGTAPRSGEDLLQGD